MADQDGLALPVVNLDGKVVGVKTVTMQTVKTDDKEKIRIVTRTIPRCVSSGGLVFSFVYHYLVLKRSRNGALCVYACATTI